MKDNIEAIGKLGISTLAVCGLIWIVYALITGVLTKQVELTERQTVALEQLVKIYSGK